MLQKTLSFLHSTKIEQITKTQVIFLNKMAPVLKNRRHFSLLHSLRSNTTTTFRPAARAYSQRYHLLFSGGKGFEFSLRGNERSIEDDWINRIVVRVINAHYFALQVDLATHSSSNFLLWGYKLSWNYLSFWWPHSATSYAKALLISVIWMYLHNIYLTNILYSAFFLAAFVWCF